MAVWYYASVLSKNMLFDSLLFGIIIFVAFNTSMMLMGESSGFSTRQYIGVGIVALGFVMMQVK